MRTTLLGALLLLTACATHKPGLPIAAPSAVDLAPEALAAIEPALRTFVDSAKTGGIYAVIVRHGQIAYERVIGFRDVERRKPLRRDDIFRVYSMTKPVVAAGLLRLIDQHKVSLDDPVSKYLPAFANIRVFAGGTADAPVLAPPDSPMTIRHLLTHTSGLGYGLTSTPADTLFTRAHLYDAANTLAQFADSVARLPLLFSPGTRYSYSCGLEIVGRIIEVVSGQSLDRYMRAELFEPLGMMHTSFRRSGSIDKKLTVLYTPGEDGHIQTISNDGLQKMFEPDARFLWASGGLLSSPDDYMRFAEMLLNGGELNGVRVLSKEIVGEMTHNQLPPALTPINLSYDGGYGYGLAGAVLVDSTRSRLPGSPGIYRWNGYVGTYFWIDPKNDLLAMVWTQLSPGRAIPLEREFQKLVYTALKR